jgi:hypothetical protein
VEEFLRDLAGDWVVSAPNGKDDLSKKMRREVWAAWWKVTDGPALLAEFKKRSLDDADREQAEKLIAQLADAGVDVRDKAMTELLAKGAVVMPLVQRAAASGDDKTKQAAQKCLQIMNEKAEANPLPLAAPRLLAVRKPRGAVEALLAFLPFADDDAQQGEVQGALGYLAVRDGKVEPALAKALEDKLPLRRAAAVEAIAAADLADQRDAVRALLKDADLTVRLRAALALAGAQDRDAVPVIISLLKELPDNQAFQAEDYLRMVAQETAPDVSLAGDKVDKDKVRDAWDKWWKEKGDKVRLVRLETTQRLLGYTLVVDQYDNVKRSGKVCEVDASGKVRWSIDGLRGPIDAQVLPGDKVLIAEQNNQRVTERDFRGKVLWERQAPNILSAQRLSNGNTFIAMRNQILEIDRAGKEVFNEQHPNHDVMAAQKLRDGTIALVSNNWQYSRVDTAGKQLKNFQLQNLQFSGNPNSIDFLPGDHVLIAQSNINKVTEVDGSGKVVWEATTQYPLSGTRLPNGNTLVACFNQMRVQEFDRSGKMVWEYKDTGRTWKARRR